MATIKINNVTALTESGGTVVLDSAVTGIPAAGVTGVLPVGVTGGSGLTALGTVTSANLSHADIVYPAGHMIYIAHYSANSAAGSHATATSWLETDDFGNNPRMDLDITQTDCDKYSKICVQYSGTGMVGAGTMFTFMEARLTRDGSATPFGNRNLLLGQPAIESTWHGPIAIFGIDPSPPTSGGCKYEVQFRKHHGLDAYGGTIWPMSGETDMQATIIAWGII